MNRVKRFLADERGATAIEYGLIASLVFLAVIGSIQVFASKTSTMYNTIATKL